MSSSLLLSLQNWVVPTKVTAGHELIKYPKSPCECGPSVMVPPRLLPMHSCDQLTETSGSGASESEGTCPYPIPIQCGDHLGQDLQLAILNSSSVLTNLRGVYCLDVALLTLPPEVHPDWNLVSSESIPTPTAATLVVRRQKSLLGVCRFTHSCERKPRPSQLAANTKKLPRPQRPRRPTARLPAGLAG